MATNRILSSGNSLLIYRFFHFFSFSIGIGGDTSETYYNQEGLASIDCTSNCQGVYKLLEDTMDFMFNFNVDYENNKIAISFKSEMACYSYDDCMKK